MPRYSFQSFAIYTLLIISVTSHACPVGPPASLQGFTVSEELQINGLPTAIYQVRSADSAERIIQQTEREWKAEGYAPRRHRDAPWLIISAASEDCVTALQMKDDTGSSGFLSVSRPNKASAPMDKDTMRLLPAGTEVESSVRSKDQGRDGLTLILSASRPNAQWTGELVRRLEQSRWDAVSRQTVEGSGRQAGGERITAVGKGRQFTAIVWGGKRTEAVITIVEPL